MTPDRTPSFYLPAHTWQLLGKKTLEAEILKEALEHARGPKKQLRLSPPKDGSR